MVQSFLQSQGLDCNVVGAREYSAIVAGGTEGRYHIMVPTEQLEEARRLLRELRVREAVAHIDPPAPNHLRKAVFFAFAAAFILPIVFNYASLTHARIYWKKSPRDWRAKLNLALILILQAPPLLLAAYILHEYVAG